MPKTSSPGLKAATPIPVSSTVPETSQPRTKGGSPRKIPNSRCFQSVGFSPAARTRTSTSLGRGFGRATSITFRTSGPPRTSWLTARIVFTSFMVTQPAGTRSAGKWHDGQHSMESCQPRSPLSWRA